MHAKIRNLLATVLRWLWVTACCWVSGEQFVRELPDCFIPGETLTVVLRGPCSLARATLEEVIPPRWSPVGLQSSRWFVAFDERSRTIRWRLDIESCVPEGFWFSYKITPPPDYIEPAFFEGQAGGYIPTTGDSVIYPRNGKPMYKPIWASIQQTIEASLWGDTVMVSGGDTPFIENIVMKPGVNLQGFLEWPIYEPPVIEAASPAEPAIVAAPYTRISGFIIRSSSCGIQVSDPTVEISDCVIAGTENAGIEYVETSEGRVTNCTIVGNNGAGILCHEPSPDVVASNCIFLGNAGNDVENSTARFCLVEDEIEPGWGENNISGDPMFVDPAAGDYRLVRGSACIDAGDNAARGVEDVDILGKPRIMFGGKSETVDLGAYEYWFISASRKAETADVELSWSSRPGRVYSVSFSGDLKTWETANDRVPASEGTMTLWRDPIGWPPSVAVRFYRVMESE